MAIGSNWGKVGFPFLGGVFGWGVVLGFRKLSLSIIDNFGIFLIIELSITTSEIIVIDKNNLLSNAQH
jgi:hypothetical protein